MNDFRAAAQFTAAHAVYCVRRGIGGFRSPDISDPSGVLDLAERNVESIAAEWDSSRTAARETLAPYMEAIMCGCIAGELDFDLKPSMRWHWLRAQRFVLEYRRDIQRIAETLQAVGRLTAGELAWLLDRDRRLLVA